MNCRIIMIMKLGNTYYNYQEILNTSVNDVCIPPLTRWIIKAYVTDEF